ncbi:MAG: hypothetical protein R3B89_31570 [Polyangiaceae bacterium]
MTTRWGALALVCVSCGGLATEPSGGEPRSTDLEVVAGTSSSCALQDGEIECWGSLDFSLENHDAPVQVTPRVVEIPGEVVSVSVGGHHWCAITADRSAWCWGMNNQAQVGHVASDHEGPTRITSLDGRVAQLDAGSFSSCALTLDGEVYCWGYTALGVVPGGDDEKVSEPRLIEGFVEPVIQVEVGNTRACALTRSGAVKCWGYQALEDTLATAPQPFQLVQLPSLESGVARLLPMRERLSCVLMLDATVRCSGITFLPGVAPSQVVELPAARGVVDGGAGNGFACLLDTEGTVACLGRADLGRLGVEPPQAEALADFQFPRIEGVERISVGDAHVCVQNASGPYCWGSNEYAQLGKQAPSYEWLPQHLQL